MSKKIVTYCAVCLKVRYLTPCGPLTPEEVSDLLDNYVCSDCDGEP